jgi:hypothetical protein
MEDSSKMKKINNPHLKGNTKILQNNAEHNKEKSEKVNHY